MKVYARFTAMILTPRAAKFGMMYLDVYALDHVLFSAPRFYMVPLMGVCMVVIMLAFMQHMLTNPSLNGGIIGASAVLFAASLWRVRRQQTVDELAWMKAMIPHPSIAILTSERASLTDPRVQKLAVQVIESQRREIEERKQLITELENR